MDPEAATSATSDSERRAQVPEHAPWADVATRWSFGIGVVIFVLNMGIAWWVVCSAKGFISQPGSSAKEEAANSLRQISEHQFFGRANQIIFVSRMVELDVQLRALANQQLTVIIGMASSFSLLSIGFALFVMGIRSAFKFSGEGGPNHRLVLSSTSPGLLCFVLAAATMLFALSRPMRIDIGEFSLQADDPDQAAFSTGVRSDSGPPATATAEQLDKAFNEIFHE